MRTITLRGRKVYGGSAEGEALVTRNALGGMGVFDVETGDVIDLVPEWQGLNVTGKVLVFKTGSGSSSWAMWHQVLRFTGKSAGAYIIKEINPQAALGAAVLRIPAVTDLDADPTEVISTGDWVRVDADNGLVEVRKKE